MPRAADLIAPDAPAGGASGPPTDGAYLLASWMEKTSDDMAVVLYDALGVRHPNLVDSRAALQRVNALGAIADPRLRNLLALCRAAQDAQALPLYCTTIVDFELRRGRPASEADDILRRVGHPGDPQGVVARARGVADPKLFGVLDRLTQAIGYVEVEQGGRREVIGTALLVRPDVVMTCAHVAFTPTAAAQGILTGPPLRNIRRIRFPTTSVGGQDAGLHGDTPYLAHSNAHMITPENLDRSVTAAALGRLDFVLLRLNRVIEAVQPIDLRGGNPDGYKGLSFVIGFPGSETACFDADHIVRSEAVGGRLIHMMNTLPGMSGGCVIGENGVPVGLHEGAIPLLGPDRKPVLDDSGAECVENRAVLLSAIASDIGARRPDPLAALERPRGIVLHDPALVTRLGRRGAQLLDDPAFLGRWDALFAAATAPVDDVAWTAHPWFNGDRIRQRLEQWFAKAASPADTRQRIAFVSGPRGCGKTFMIDILRRIVVNADTDVIRVAWTEGETTLATLARRVTAQLPAPSGTRTTEGHDRYENLPDLVAALSRFGGVDRAALSDSRPLFVAIDAGDGSGSATEPDNWIDVVAALAREPWARLVLCGLPGPLRQRVEDAIPLDVDFHACELRHVDASDIARFLDAFGLSAAARGTAAQAVAAFRDAGLDAGTGAPLATSMAALLAIAWHRGVLPEAAAAPGAGT